MQIFGPTKNFHEHQQPEAQCSNPMSSPKGWKFKTDHPKEQIIGKINEGIKTRCLFKEVMNPFALISEMEPKEIDEAIANESLIEAMQEDLYQFKVNEVWELVF